MTKNDTLRRLCKQRIQAMRAEIQSTVRYLFATSGKPGILKPCIANICVTPKREKLLRLLANTMVTSQLLLAGGMVSSLRSAQRELRALRDAGLLVARQFPVATAFPYFYSIKNSQQPFHMIHEGNVAHDSITALFIIHLFRLADLREITLRWYPPFAIKDKLCDGGVTMTRQGKRICSLLLETDHGTHGHREIREKLEAYCPYLADHPTRRIVLLADKTERAQNLRQTIRQHVPQPLQPQISVLCPLTFSQDTDVLALASSPDADIGTPQQATE